MKEKKLTVSEKVHPDNLKTMIMDKVILTENEENIYKMLHEFRNWNREWDIFMAKKPDSADVFVKSLAKQYEVKPINK